MKSRFTMAGASTLPTAMDAPITRVPSHTMHSPESERTMHPPARAISAQSSTLLLSSFAVSAPIIMLNSAKARRGREPSSPCIDSPQPNVVPMLESKGPTATMAGRRFNATRKITQLASKGAALCCSGVRAFGCSMLCLCAFLVSPLFRSVYYALPFYFSGQMLELAMIGLLFMPCFLPPILWRLASWPQ